MNISSIISNAHQTPLTQQWNSCSIQKSSLIYPVFVHSKPTEPIPSLPGQFKYIPSDLVNAIEPLVKKGLRAVLLFGLPDYKDELGSGIDDPASPVIQAIKILRKSFPQLLVSCDVCICAYTTHGHCGILSSSGSIDTLKSISRLAEISANLCKAGCQLIAPSDMMDGRIKAIKEALARDNLKVPIMSYAAKFASCFYGPFRDAACSKPTDKSTTDNEAITKDTPKDRKGYQLPVGSSVLALRALERDVQEGADFIMVKPAYPYLDIVKQANTLGRPVAIYQTSGEYCMLWYAAQHGVFELRDGVLESLIGCKRAGADILITYYAPRLLDWLSDE